MPKRTGPGAKKLLLDFFIENVGKVVNFEQLRQASGNTSEWARRVRELRTELGYEILSHRDRPDLARGEYMLASLEQKTVNVRVISKKTHALVLDRDGYTCQSCGAVAGSKHPFDGRPVCLTTGHWLDKSKGGTDDADNLRALCTVCNEGASNITPARHGAVELLTLIRRAPLIEQIKVLEALAGQLRPREEDWDRWVKPSLASGLFPRAVGSPEQQRH